MSLMILTSGICLKKQLKKDICSLQFIPDNFQTREMCEKVVEKYPWLLNYISDCHKTKELSNEVVQKIPCILEYVPSGVQEQLRSGDEVYIKW